MLKFFLCLKYLRRIKIMLLSILAVAMSCALLIVVGSLFTGFIDSIENTAQDFMGDIILTPKGRITKYDKLIEMIVSDPDFEAATPVLSTQGLLHIGKGKVRSAIVWGIDPATRANVTIIKNSLIVQSDGNEPPCFKNYDKKNLLDGFVSIALLAKPDEKTDKYDIEKITSEFIDKKIVLTTGSIDNTQNDIQLDTLTKSNISNFRQKRIIVNISDIVFTGIHQFDNRYVYLPIEQLSRKLYNTSDNGFANIIHTKTTNGVDAGKATMKLWGIWSQFAREQLGWSGLAISSAEIETSRQMQANHTAELHKQMVMLLLIFGIVSCAVVALVFCIFYMIVMTRIKDIAIIKSFGASCSSVMTIFVFYGIAVGLSGAGIGLLLGFYITKYINEIERWIRIVFGLKLWDSSVYLFTKAPNVVDWSTVAWVLPAAVIAAGLGAVIPALVAAKIRPVKILQYE